MPNKKKRLGLTLKTVETHPNRWSKGKIHIMFWNREFKQWVFWCRPRDVGTFRGYYHHEINNWQEPTCRFCLKKWKGVN